MSDLYNSQKVELTLTDNQTITLETGKYASLANGSVFVSSGDTRILVTCCYSKEPKPGIDFFPLTVDLEEKIYSIGKIPSSYARREGKPSDKAVLISRLIDRPFRPLFPKGFRNDVQIVATVLSSDRQEPIEPLCILGASTAISLAGLPIASQLGAVRVGLVNDSFVINPSYETKSLSSLDLMVAGNGKNIMMVEAGADFVTEETLLSALEFAQEYINRQIDAQHQLIQQCNVQPMEFTPPSDNPDLQKLAEELTKEKLTLSIQSALTDKSQREIIVQEAYDNIRKHFDGLEASDETENNYKLTLQYAKDVEKSLMRNQIISEGIRIDGRKCNEVRPIWSEVGVLPRTHGDAVFTRGSTQVMSVVTLGSLSDAKPLDGIAPETEQTYFHNYNFPAYSVGEARPARSPGRREIGHGALAEKALIPALPSKDSFPYAIRVVSEALSSNGSTSMASTCGSSLALMDAGVPLKCTVGGIAMGLIIEGNQCAVLTDIQGVEDFLGDMDFKVTGSDQGVTALQLDLKLSDGISLKVLKAALSQALEGRQHIISKMEETIQTSRENVSSFAPQVLILKISPKDIGTIIGSGGKTIKRLIETHKVDKIDIDDDGSVTVVGSYEATRSAEAEIRSLTLEVRENQQYTGKVIRKIEIGVFVELAPGKVGMYKVPQSHEDYSKFDIGSTVLTEITQVDNRGRINLKILEIVE